ncbi:MAG: zf-HC2 domain-containing protein [Proteobacteria bacterium]|nr:zf-HC2 domain-containing protein [Pseudomonadota bacterium]
MNCRQAEKNLSAYLDRELELKDAKALEAHLSDCPRCREKLAELEKIEKAISAFPERDPSPFLWTRVKAGVESGAEPAKPLARPVLARFRLAPVPVRWAGIALFLAVILGGVVFSLRREAERPRSAGLEIVVAENLDLLENYELIQDLDILENWEGKS